MSKKKAKTNVMRQLDQHHIPYRHCPWEQAKEMGIDAPVYKTLVTQGKSGEHYVFVVPKDHELDLKKAAKAVGEKNIHMIHQKELLPLTGYIHGGCSPIGMKKAFLTTVDQSALDYDTILVSAGRVGESVEIDPRRLNELVKTQFADIRTEE